MTITFVGLSYYDTRLGCLTSTADLSQESSATDFCFGWEVFRVRLPVGLGVSEARRMTDEVKHWASTCLCSFVTLCGSEIDQASIRKTSSSILAAFNRRVFSLSDFIYQIPSTISFLTDCPLLLWNTQILSKPVFYQHWRLFLPWKKNNNGQQKLLLLDKIDAFLTVCGKNLPQRI